MNIDPRVISELREMGPAKLQATIKQMEEQARYAPPMGLYAEAQGDMDTGSVTAGFRKWKDSPYDRDRLKPEHRKGHQRTHEFDIPDIRKRTERERVESMTNRLMKAIESQPWEAELILRGTVAESWRAGHPVSFDELKTVVEPFIRQAAQTQVPTRATNRIHTSP